MARCDASGKAPPAGMASQSSCSAGDHLRLVRTGPLPHELTGVRHNAKIMDSPVAELRLTLLTVIVRTPPKLPVRNEMRLQVTALSIRMIGCRPVLVFRAKSALVFAWPKAFIATAAWLLLCFSFTSARAQGEPSDDIIRIDTNLISVPVIVSDRAGHYVPGLGVHDFKLYDNNVEQKISLFDAAEEPLNVVLLLDTSRSTQGVLGEIRNAARDFLKELRPQDRAMIISFDKDVHKLSALTSDRGVLEKAIKHTEVSKYFGTLLNDAVLETSKSVLQPVTGRKAIILLTDGEDGGSQIGAADLLAYESEADAMIYSIYYESSLHSGGGGFRFPRLGGIFGRSDRRSQKPQERGTGAVDFLTRLSEMTGGRFYRSKATDLNKAFALVAAGLRHQYRLGFYPAKLAQDGSVHSLKVKVDRADAAVRSRRQYRTKPPS